MEPDKIGKLIRSLRLERGLTQEGLGARLGVTDKTVSKWERGRGIPDISLLRGLSAIFEIDPAVLLEGEIHPAGPVGGNMKRLKFYVCESCGNILTATGAGEVFCCGRKLEALKAAAAEGEHLPEIRDSDGERYAVLPHPMAKDHFISFAAFAEYDRVLLLKLYPEQEAAFRFAGRSRGTLYVYCSRHGLFQTKL